MNGVPANTNTTWSIVCGIHNIMSLRMSNVQVMFAASSTLCVLNESKILLGTQTDFDQQNIAS